MTVAASFVATDQSQLEILDAVQTGLDMGTGDAAISMSFYVGTLGTYYLTRKGASSDANSGFIVYLSNANIVIYFCATSRINTTISAGVTAGAWHSLVVNFDRDGNESVYVDNVLKGTLDISAQAAGNVDSIGRFALGTNGVGQTGLTGSIARVRFWNRILTSGEIARQANMSGGVHYARPYSQLSAAEKTGLVSAWELDDGPWSATQTADDAHGGNDLSFVTYTAATDIDTGTGPLETNEATPGMIPYMLLPLLWDDQPRLSYMQSSTVEGVEFTLSLDRLHFSLKTNPTHFTIPANRLHFTLETNRPHFTLPKNRPHFTITEDN